jgi:predicted GNAT family N-acyltransferase
MQHNFFNSRVKFLLIDALRLGDYHIPKKAGKLMIIVHVSNQNELTQCMDIRRRVFIEEQSVPEIEEIDEHDRIGDPIADHFLFVMDKRAIGTVRCIKKDGNVLKIGRVAVLKEERNKGLGKQMMDLIESYYTTYRLFVLDAQTHAIPFYLKCGYVLAGEIFMDAGIPHRHMEKSNPRNR